MLCLSLDLIYVKDTRIRYAHCLSLEILHSLLTRDCAVNCKYVKYHLGKGSRPVRGVSESQAQGRMRELTFWLMSLVSGGHGHVPIVKVMFNAPEVENEDDAMPIAPVDAPALERFLPLDSDGVEEWGSASNELATRSAKGRTMSGSATYRAGLEFPMFIRFRRT